MSKCISHRIYTDVESYLVTEIDEFKGTAMAIRVEKRIRPDWRPRCTANLERHGDRLVIIEKAVLRDLKYCRTSVPLQGGRDPSPDL